eukprot:CFRG6909T1
MSKRLGWSDLHRAARKGDTDSVQKLLHEGRFKVHVRDAFGQTPLHHALLQRRFKTINFLVAHGTASLHVPDNDGRTPSLIAFSVGAALTLCSDLESCLANTLVDNKGRGIVHYAAGACDPQSLELALNLIGTQHENIPRDYTGQTPLHYAIGHPINKGCERCVECVLLLLNHYSSTDGLFLQDYFGRTVAHIAAWRSRLDNLMALSKIFSDRNEELMRLLNVPDYNGCTVLHVAHFNCDLAMATHLRSHIELPVQNDGWGRMPKDCRDTEKSDVTKEADVLAWSVLDQCLSPYDRKDATLPSTHVSTSSFVTCNHGYDVPVQHIYARRSSRYHLNQVPPLPYGTFGCYPKYCVEQIVSDDLKSFKQYHHSACSGSPTIVSPLNHELCHSLTKLRHPLVTVESVQVKRITDINNPAFRSAVGQQSAGFGLFAKNVIFKDTVIGEYVGFVRRVDDIEDELEDEQIRPSVSRLGDKSEWAVIPKEYSIELHTCPKDMSDQYCTCTSHEEIVIDASKHRNALGFMNDFRCNPNSLPKTSIEEIQPSTPESQKAQAGTPRCRTQNTHLVQIMYNGWPRIVGVTIENVQAGEELLIDYGRNFFSV